MTFTSWDSVQVADSPVPLSSREVYSDQEGEERGPAGSPAMAGSLEPGEAEPVELEEGQTHPAEERTPVAEVVGQVVQEAE